MPEPGLSEGRRADRAARQDMNASSRRLGDHGRVVEPAEGRTDLLKGHRLRFGHHDF